MRINQLLVESKLIDALGKQFPNDIPIFKYLHAQNIVLDHDPVVPFTVNKFNDTKLYAAEVRTLFLIKTAKGWCTALITNYSHPEINITSITEERMETYLAGYIENNILPSDIVERNLGKIEQIYKIPYHGSKLSARKDVIVNRHLSKSNRDIEAIYNRYLDKVDATSDKPSSRNFPTYKFNKTTPSRPTHEQAYYYDFMDKSWKLRDLIFRKIRTNLSRKIRRGVLEFPSERYRKRFEDLFDQINETLKTDDLWEITDGSSELADAIYNMEADETGGPNFEEGFTDVWYYLAKRAFQAARVNPKEVYDEKGVKKYSGIFNALVNVIEKYIEYEFLRKPR